MFASNMPVNSTPRSDVPQRRIGPELSVQNVVPSVNDARNIETASANNVRNSGTQTNPAARIPQMRTVVNERFIQDYNASLRQAPVTNGQNQYYSLMPMDNSENPANSSLSDSSPNMPIRNANHMRMRFYNPLARPPRTPNSNNAANDVQNRFERQGNENSPGSVRHETSWNARRVTYASNTMPMMRFLHEMDNLIGNNLLGSNNS